MRAGRARALLSASLVACTLVACLGSTGSDLVTFSADASGVTDVRAGVPFVTGRGWSVTLDHAVVHLAAVFLRRNAPVSGAQARTCYASGGYLGEVLQGRDIDLLSGAPQAFEGGGRGTRDLARSCEVWLGGARIDDENDNTAVFAASGMAARGTDVIPFTARLTIGKSRIAASNDPTRPGATPLCSLRIVAPIGCAVLPEQGGTLHVRIDARSVFGNVEFSDLPAPSGEPNGPRAFLDSNDGQPNINLFSGIRASGGTYALDWQTAAGP